MIVLIHFWQDPSALLLTTCKKTVKWSYGRSKIIAKSLFFFFFCMCVCACKACWLWGSNADIPVHLQENDLRIFKLKIIITGWLYLKWNNSKSFSSRFSRVVLQCSEHCLFFFFFLSDGALGFVSKVSVFQRFAAKLLNFLTHFSLKE